MKSTGSSSLESFSRAANLNLSNVWLGSISQSLGMKSALCFHQTFTAMLRSYDRTWWYLVRQISNVKCHECVLVYHPWRNLGKDSKYKNNKKVLKKHEVVTNMASCVFRSCRDMVLEVGWSTSFAPCHESISHKPIGNNSRSDWIKFCHSFESQPILNQTNFQLQIVLFTVDWKMSPGALSI